MTAFYFERSKKSKKPKIFIKNILKKNHPTNIIANIFSSVSTKMLGVSLVTRVSGFCHHCPRQTLLVWYEDGWPNLGIVSARFKILWQLSHLVKRFLRGVVWMPFGPKNKFHFLRSLFCLSCPFLSLYSTLYTELKNLPRSVVISGTIKLIGHMWWRGLQNSQRDPAA